MDKHSLLGSPQRLNYLEEEGEKGRHCFWKNNSRILWWWGRVWATLGNFLPMGKGQVVPRAAGGGFWADSKESVPRPDFATWAWGPRERWGPGGPKAAMGSRQVQPQV